ncbi:putative Pfs, NB-ARC and TPR domain protein (JCVI) [Paramyrothecium foliicola]|nr:putative Pfs, NB-ARC and TPR domain protein (JCVI) [Paramyrothecium foliicola]
MLCTNLTVEPILEICPSTIPYMVEHESPRNSFGYVPIDAESEYWSNLWTPDADETFVGPAGIEHSLAHVDVTKRTLPVKAARLSPIFVHRWLTAIACSHFGGCGGGVHGLSSVYILKSIMDQLNQARGKDRFPRVKPCQIFDLIGGTGTGGLIAIMLGRLEMDIDQCIEAYSGLATLVFGSPLTSADRACSIPIQFNIETLETAVRDIIKNSGARESDLFNDSVERGCRTFVCTADRHTNDIVRLRSYRSDERDLGVTICQAALATCATTTFFKPVAIKARSFAEGWLGANNPVDEVEGEAASIWCPDGDDLKPLVKCFISIGTGNPGKRPFEDRMAQFLAQTVVEIAVETEATEKKFIAR